MALRKRTKKLILLAGAGLMVAGVALYFFIANEKFADTGSRKPQFTTHALDFIREFEKDYQAANKKYAEKIIAVNGRVSEIEPADTAVNVKFIDSTSGSYVIFAFQEQHIVEARSLQVGDSVSIKGSFSSGLFSEILGNTFITFKRSALNN